MAWSGVRYPLDLLEISTEHPIFVKPAQMQILYEILRNVKKSLSAKMIFGNEVIKIYYMSALRYINSQQMTL